ncbi:MAG: hypothetical protein WBI95_24570 [Pseudomonas veronii]|uniref:hypothetical protein n=1 Tax=Pseudomonas veronii TaxID=76761 RepID=UPI003C736616
MSDSKVSSTAESIASEPVDVPQRKRSASIQTLDVPLVPEALPLLSDEAAYTIPLALQNQPLMVTIERVWPVNFANVSMTTLVQYLWQGLEVHRHEIFGPYEPDVEFPLVQLLPASVLSTGGIRQLTYRVSAPLLTTTDSFRAMVNVDKNAPNNGNQGPALIFDPEVISDGVTDDYLVAHNGVDAEVVRWPDIRLEDRIEFFWGELPNVRSAGTLSIGLGHIAGAPIEIHFDEAFIRDSGEGRRFASYQLTDRAGNVGPFSTVNEINVNLQVLPDLPRPEVPLAEFDGLIDLDDARTGVVIEIPQIFGAQENDRLVIFWNTHSLPPITVGAGQAWPIRVPVSWEILSAGGFAQSIPVRVRYLFQRGTASRNSPNNFFIQDLSVAGPDPQGPDPINTQLARVVVKGVTGDDVVTELDAPGPVRVEVPLWSTPAPVPGHRLELFWGGEAAFVGDYEIQPTDLPGQTVAFFVPWIVIMGAASGQIPVYYWTDNSVNRQRSPTKLVRVELDTLRGLEKPVLLNDSTRDFVACDTRPEPWTGVFIGVLWDVTHFEVGDRIQVYWSSYPTKAGNGDPFPGTSVTFDVVLTEDHRNAGRVDVLITPFDPLFTRPGLVSDFGSGVTYYRLFKVSGATGVSSKKLIFINLKRPLGGVCLGPVRTS